MEGQITSFARRKVRQREVLVAAMGRWPRGAAQRERTRPATASSLAASAASRASGAVITAFSSKHQGGANFAMCDGRVLFISEKIDSKLVDENNTTLGTYQKLSIRNDGQPVGEF